VYDIRHQISLADPRAHLLAITTTFRAGNAPLPSPFRVFMPVWTPGSYLVREYARHVERFGARADGIPTTQRKIRKNAWEIAHTGAHTIEVTYHLYANDLSVRTNHVDETHAYWNGAATYLASEDAPHLGARVTVQVPASWQIATSLIPSEAEGGPTYAARDFDELCDAPFECGELILREFVTLGKLHRIAATNNADAREVDWDKLARDTQTIVESEARLLAGDRAPEAALPYPSYLFIWHVTGRGRGGLEHRDSTTLMAKASSFQTRAGYLDVLSLIAHEFFHLWNVKRVRPQGLTPYRYEEENYTRLLWWFEGATSYYDWRMLRSAGLCTGAEYLGHLADELGRLEDTPGAGVHPLEEASFDAWIKAYRPDENSLNSTVSYYLKGEVVCALLDLELRHRTEGRSSLDDVVRHLDATYARAGLPVPEDAFPGVFRAATRASLDDCFERWVRTAQPIDVNAVLALAGLTFTRRSKEPALPSMGVRLRLDSGRLLVDAVVRGGAAHRAGIDVRDEIIAVGGKRVIEGRVDLPLTGRSAGEKVAVVLARDGWVRELDVTLDAPLPGEPKIVVDPKRTPEQRALGEAWLGEALPSPAAGSVDERQP
jgi:predicted metalloprotease with PDZ domain